MAFDVINTGTTANDGTGDPLRTAFTKVNDNTAKAVEGAASSTDGTVVTFDGTTGKVVKASSKVTADLVTGPASATSGRVAVYNGTTGKLLQDGTKLEADLVVGPASVASGRIAAFDGTTGKLVQEGVGDGAVGTPSVTFASDLDTGMWRPAADTLAFSTNGAERLRIDASGNVGIGLTPTSRNNTRLQIVDGIGFPATQVASTDANTLDDYEEGTWTPVLTYQTPGDLSVSYNEQTGVYTKIGRVVHIHFRVQLSAFTKGTATGQLRITGLPFSSSIPHNQSILGTFDAPFTGVPIVFAESSFLRLQQLSDNSAWAVLDDPDADSQYSGQVTYYVS